MRLPAVALALLLAVPLFPPSLQASTTGQFKGGAPSVELELAAPDHSVSATFTVEYPGIAWHGTLNVSTVAGQAPLAPSLDACGDGVVDWEFNASYGAFGRQSLFTDGRANLTLPVLGDAGTRRQVVLPVDADITSATLLLNGTPTEPVRAAASWRNNVVAAGGTLTQVLPDIAAFATGINASVCIFNGTKTVVDQEQDDESADEYCGWAGARRSLSQTFTVALDGEIVEMQLWINRIVGNPGSLSGEIRAVDQNGTPTATRLSSSFFAPQSSFSVGAWNPLSFQNVPVEAGRTYALAIYASSQGTTSENSYRFGANTSDNLSGGSAWSYPNGNAGGTPTLLDGTDLAFRALVRTSLTPPDFLALSVNGTAVSGPDGSGRYWSNFSVPVYDNGNWSVDLRNDNPFDVSYLNWSAETWHQNHVDSASALVAGALAWSSGGKVFGPVSAPLDPGAFRRALAALVDVYPDRFGVRTGELDLDLLAVGRGVLEVVSFNITYDLTLRVPDFRYPLRDFLAGRPAGTVEVPVKVTAASAGRVLLSHLQVVVDQPPRVTGAVPSNLRIPEDGLDLELANLSAWFEDDLDSSLVFSLVNNSDASKVVVGFNGTFLTARAIAENWTGSVSVEIGATDARGQHARAGPFDVTVFPVNDAPEILSMPPARARQGRELRYQLEAADAENDTLSFGLEEGPAGMAVGPSGLLAWVPSADQLGAQRVAVFVSDGLLGTLQEFCVTVVNDNRPPAVLAPSPMNGTGHAGKPYHCQFRAQDPDPGENFTFSLDSGPPGMVIDASTGLVSWPSPVEGNFSVRVRLTDGIDFAFFSYELGVTTNRPPAFSSRPSLGATVGELYTYQLVGTDPDEGTVVTMALVSGPEGMNLEPGGQLMWTPRKEQRGVHPVVVSVSDGIDTVTQSFNVTVREPMTGGGSDLTGAFVGLVVVLAACALVGGLVVTRRRRRKPAGPDNP
ncbi:MAG: hypothetical protein FJ149_07850 [Euryarchaeota archaeon]|nr:hypothetical protein [Euryarchaeota archaeon]